ncbi:MAG: aromatic ring-hydroxylating dioxygenase subunit alpha [Candidatus Binatia bacterium]
MGTNLSGMIERERVALRRTRADLLDARHLPGEFYTSAEIYAQEVEKIFMKDWLCVGRVEQWSQPGDFRALRIADEPLLICRDQQGSLNAFSNVCRHRGVEVAFGTGNQTEFQCPYHGWLYDLEGKLVGAPYSKEVKTFDFANCRLPRVKLDTWAGYVFVNFDPSSPSLGEYLAQDEGVRKAQELLHPERTRICDEFTFEIECNWKFIPENLMDIYHAKVVHGSSFAKKFTMEGYPFRLGKNGRYHAEYESLTMAPDGIILFGPMPWLRDRSEYLAFTVFIPPTFNLFGRQDLIQPWVSLPLAPDRTQITIWTQLPEEHFASPAFEEKTDILKNFIRLVAAEDSAMLRSLHKGVRSRSYVPGPTIQLEKAIHHLLNYYLDRMFGESAGRPV